MPGRPHVLNLVRRMLVPMVGNRVAERGGNRNPMDNARRIFVQEQQQQHQQQARVERTPEKGNSNGDVDEKKMG